MNEALKALKYLDEHNLNWHDNPTKERVNIVKEELNKFEKLKSHTVEIDNNPDNGDDYYFIVLEKTKIVRELLEELKNE